MFISPIGGSAPPPAPPKTSEYIVQRGDTLSSIAIRHQVPLATVKAANPHIVNPDILYPGQSVNVPIADHQDAQGSASATVSAADGNPAALDLTGTAKTTHTSKLGTDANNTTSTRSNKVSIGNDGSATLGGSGSQSTTRTNAAGTKTVTDAHGSGDVAVDPNAGTISLSGGTGFSKAITNSKGVGVSFGIDANATVVAGKKTSKGVTTYSASTDASIALNAGVKSKQAGLTVGHTEGIKASFEVSMPEQAAKSTDLAKVNPFDPSSMPKGTVIKLDGSRYTSNEFEATFKNISNKYTHTDAKGTSLLVEKTGDHTVRVTAGPTEAIDAYNGVGVDFGVASAMLGRNDHLDGATLKTAQFDLATPQGKAAFNDLAANGNMPADNGQGISGVKTIQKLNYSSQAKLDVKLGPVSFGLDGAKNTGSSVMVTQPDGTATRIVNLQYSDNPPLTISQKFDASGKEIIGARTYAYTFNADANVAQMLNVAQTGNRQKATSGPVKPGQTVVITYTQAEMTALRDDTIKAGSMPGSRLQGLASSMDGKPFSPEQFATILASSLTESGNFGRAERLYDISMGATGSYTGGLTKLPGTLSVVG